MINIARRIKRRLAAFFRIACLSYPKNVECNLCGWSGRHFESGIWHKWSICPKCGSDVRHRLLIAALQSVEGVGYDDLVTGKSVLHFAPEAQITSAIKPKAANYTTADFLREDCDLRLDMSNMLQVPNETYDAVIASDVLEHVPNYKNAIDEIHRVLKLGGTAILTFPQKDFLEITFEDEKIVSPEDREKHFGQWDHLRIFGNDISSTLKQRGFAVVEISEKAFNELAVQQHVLRPPFLSSHPLATNYRKIFFCRKLKS